MADPFARNPYAGQDVPNAMDGPQYNDFRFNGGQTAGQVVPEPGTQRNATGVVDYNQNKGYSNDFLRPPQPVQASNATQPIPDYTPRKENAYSGPTAFSNLEGRPGYQNWVNKGGGQLVQKQDQLKLGLKPLAPKTPMLGKPLFKGYDQAAHKSSLNGFMQQNGMEPNDQAEYLKANGLA